MNTQSIQRFVRQTMVAASVQNAVFGEASDKAWAKIDAGIKEEEAAEKASKAEKKLKKLHAKLDKKAKKYAKQSEGAFAGQSSTKFTTAASAMEALREQLAALDNDVAKTFLPAVETTPAVKASTPLSADDLSNAAVQLVLTRNGSISEAATIGNLIKEILDGRIQVKAETVSGDQGSAAEGAVVGAPVVTQNGDTTDVEVVINHSLRSGPAEGSSAMADALRNRDRNRNHPRGERNNRRGGGVNIDQK